MSQHRYEPCIFINHKDLKDRKAMRSRFLPTAGLRPAFLRVARGKALPYAVLVMGIYSAFSRGPRARMLQRAALRPWGGSGSAWIQEPCPFANFAVFEVFAVQFSVDYLCRRV